MDESKNLDFPNDAIDRVTRTAKIPGMTPHHDTWIEALTITNRCSFLAKKAETRLLSI